MAKYTFTCEHFDYDNYRGDELDVASKHTTEFRADTLETMLENFEMFLRGAGFQFDGVLDVVKPEEEIVYHNDDIQFDFSEIPQNNWPFAENVSRSEINFASEK
jgi:hypothetical protein